MHSICSILNFAGKRQALQLAVTGCSTACSRYLCGVSEAGNSPNEEVKDNHEEAFDAAEHGAPVVVQQLIGDPRTGIADDTTTTPWGDDVTVEWIWSSDATGVDWYRYSMAGPDQLPFMYMDSRLSDHSKNLMYMLRCKDPSRWTIPALADKFRIRRQRVMAILALKEMEAHQIDQGHSLTGHVQSYSFKIPLDDFHLRPDGEPVDLAELVQQQQSQQQQQHRDVTVAAAAAVDSEDVLPGLGSLEDFLATDAPAEVVGHAASTADDSTLSSLLPSAGHELHQDLAVLMPQVATASQQLQLQLLQLLQQHHHSTDELQQRLLQQVDVAEAYYNNKIAGTELEGKLRTMMSGPAAAAVEVDSRETVADALVEGDAAPEAEGASAAARHAWLDFEEHRRQIKELISQLAPLLQSAGSPEDQATGRALHALKNALQQAAAGGAAAAGSEMGSDQGKEQLAAQAVSQVVESCASAPAVFARAFNQLEVAQRHQLLDLAPGARMLLNITGTDLRASLAGTGQADNRSTAAAAGSVGDPPAGQWPGALPPLIDVWGYEEVPRKLLGALAERLPQVQTLLQQLQADFAGTAAEPGSSSSKHVIADGVRDLQILQQAIQVYCTLLWEYDQVLQQQTAAAASAEVALLPHAAQRRLVRILRELDRHAIEKLLLWESYCKEEADPEASGGRDKGQRLRRLKLRVSAAIRQLNQQEKAAGGGDEEYPDLPADAGSTSHYDKDVAAAHLDAGIVGRQFHRGSGDRHFVRLDSYPAFEGYSLEEFDQIEEGELSKISRLAAEREDNMMWKEFREKLLLNIGLTAPDLYQHLSKARPPKPQDGWTWVVHPVGGAARARTKKELRRQSRQQWLDDSNNTGNQVHPGSWKPLQGFDPATSAAPSAPYAAEPSRQYRGLNEEEAVVAGNSRAKPRKRWYASMRSRPR